MRTSALTAVVRARSSAAAGVRGSAVRSFSALPNHSTASASASAGTPAAAATAPHNSFIRRHPKKVAAGALLSAGTVAYFASKAAKPAAADKPQLPPFNIDDYKGFGSLDNFKRGQDIVLYQYETCPFCNKLRAYLDWSGISYRTVEVNPMNKKQLKQNPSPPELAAVKTVPALVINGHVQTESTDIIKNLHRIMSLYTHAKELDQNEVSGLEFVDKRVIPLTAPNLYRNWSESVASFDYIQRNSQLAASESKLSQLAAKYFGAAAMRALTHFKLNKKYNITDARQSLYAACRDWEAALPADAPFRGGAKPNTADVACFGVFRALRGYATFDDAMNPANTSQRFAKWFTDMDKQVTANAVVAKQ